MWKRSSNRYGTTPIPETPYQKAAQVWDERIGSARVQAKNWRLVAFGTLGLSFLMASGLVWQGAQSRIIPYIVEVDQAGSVRAVGPVSDKFRPSDAQIANQLARFITNVRSISIDPVVLRQNWMEAYAFATDQASITLNSYAQANDPFAEVGQRSVTVDVSSIVRSSDDSFEIRWRETEFRGGAQMGTQTFTAIVSIIFQPPRDADTLHQNPLGLYVHGLHWSKDLTTGTTP
ncbi:MAG: conjugal transfer protein TrbF [Robiginitomaculum sp.]|nr:MAG: conjugal transfer protein TrbF [Robiginitomaculum sp.]